MSMAHFQATTVFSFSCPGDSLGDRFPFFSFKSVYLYQLRNENKIKVSYIMVMHIQHITDYQGPEVKLMKL